MHFIIQNNDSKHDLSLWLYRGQTHSTFPLWLYTALIQVNFAHKTLLNPQNINCLLLWIKLTIAWDFCLPHI